MTERALFPILVLLMCLFFFGAPVADAQETITWPQVSLSVEVSGLALPVHVAHAGDGSGRLFITEQAGRIRVAANGVLSPLPFLDISDRVSCCGERGLLSVAFPPGYAVKRYFYVYYTDVAGNTVVARYRLSSSPDTADAGSEEVILRVTQPFANHNGGQLAFGPDGFLYIGMGDGGSGGDPNNYAQNLSPLSGNQRLLGKLLRIDTEAGSSPYAIPPDNPLLLGTRSEVWALGLRNPWRFSFDRMTGDLYIGDVGQNTLEEIDFQPAGSPGGQNYGWRRMEGTNCFNPASGCNDGTLTLPVHTYSHAQGDCSVTGGFVYRGPVLGAEGIYLYSDFCTGRIWGLSNQTDSWQSQPLFDANFNITTFGEDEAGNLYVSDYFGGTIQRIDFLTALPVALESFSYAAEAQPVRSIDPARMKPLAFGNVASGGDTLRLQVGLNRFTSPVDVFLGIYAPAIDPSNVYVVRSDGSVQPATQGIPAWRSVVLEVDEPLFGEISLPAIPRGTYTFYIVVTPTRRTDPFYLWSTGLTVP